jgi:phosphatidylserine/phosphatidylglycerophosphate/cardiolipin synthase-like enzyme
VNNLPALSTEVARLANDLPNDLIQALAQALAACDAQDWSYTRLRLLDITAQPRFRAHVEQLLAAWQQYAPSMPPESMAVALLAASASAELHHREQSVELLWTGPDAGVVPLRRTDQALLQVVDAARESLLIVSFAVYKIPAIKSALALATQRGVAEQICVESPETSGNRMASDTIKALGDAAPHAAIYIWPKEQRVLGANGTLGLLHAKCAVADNRLLFISSANLTEHAMSINMELGVLIQGGPLPGDVARQFAELIARGILVRLQQA